MRGRFASTFALCLMLAPDGGAGQQTIQLPARDRVLPEKPEVLYTLGAESGQDWELLSGVRAVDFDGRDNLYVLDANNFRVLVLDAAGRFVRSIGGQGGGPGEMTRPSGMAILADGTIVVSDAGRRAYSLFGSDGRFLRQVAYADGEGVGGREEGLHAHPRGGVVAHIYPLRDRTDALETPRRERQASIKWIDFSAAAGTSTTLYTFAMPSITRVEPQRGGGVSITTVPPNWSPVLTSGVRPNGGVVIAEEAAYRIKLLDASGKLERILERPIPPRKGTQKDKDVFIAREAESIAVSAGRTGRSRPGATAAAGNAPPVARIEEMLRTATWMDVIPVLRGVTVDLQDRIWAARTPDDFGVHSPIDVLRADGIYIGTVPNATLPSAISRTGRAAFVARDSLGVERVRVVRLPAAWR
jgi:hypothetical protein